MTPDLELLPRLAFLRSARLARLLRERLAAETERPVRPDEVRGALFASAFNPQAHLLRQDDAVAAVTALWNDAGTGEGLYGFGALHEPGILSDLARDHLFHAGGRYEVKPQCLLDYCRLIRDVHPAFLVAVWHVEHLRAGEIDVEALEAGLERQCPLALPPGDPDRPHADNHVHLNGVGVASQPLAALAFGEGRLHREPDVPLNPALELGGGFGCRDLARLLNASVWYILQAACGGERDGVVADQRRILAEKEKRISGTLIEERLIGPAGVSRLDVPRALARAMARRLGRDDTAGALQMLATLALYLHETAEPAAHRLRLSVLALVHATHLLRSAIIVSGKGLTNFVKYYNSDMRFEGWRYQEGDRWRLLIGNGGDMVDAKIATTDIDRFRDLARMAARAADGLGDPLRPARHGWRRYHLSYHFIRDAAGRPGRIGFSRERRLAEIRARELRIMLRKVAWVESSEGPAPGAGPAGGPRVRQNLTSWIRSFDVAGDETKVPVEVFAPALRWLRDKPLVQVLHGRARASARRAFSIHAGEDFSDIVSGLRHTEETVEFCGLGVDDRIGHGLALGLDPHAWAARQGLAIVPLQAHVDNLVWLWHHATALANRVEVAGRVLPLLRRRLDFFLHELHGGSAPDPEVLHRAWRLRRNCPTRMLRDPVDRWHADTRYWAPDLVADPDIASRPEFGEYVRYVSTAATDAARRRASPPVQVRQGRAGESGRMQGRFVDHVCPDELDLVAAVQDHLLTRFDARGIVIEACPTSNLYIARLDGYEEHPLFRWAPPDPALLAPGARFNRFGLRTGPVAVCLNTDDPAIMPTTILTEHHLAWEAAVRCHGVSREAAGAWIGRIRTTGVDLFQRTHRDTDLHPSPNDGGRLP
ncbi:MAG TPA: hypothetical protein VED40_02580 [Azospirillaceae bacterium]|nr:hypothetical protein [Azospirillaceae bacterium]